MSINISSDESEDLPYIDLGVMNKVVTPQKLLNSPLVKDNDCVDLTQKFNQVDELVVQSTSNRSLKMKHDISPSQTSDVIDLKENDILFDNILKTVAPNTLESCHSSNSGVSGSSGSSGYGSGNGCVSFQSSSKRKTTPSEKVTKKQKVAEEKAKRAAATEINKRYKPAECMKYMVLRMHPALRSSWYMSELDREVSARVIEDDTMVHQHLLMWCRRGQNTLTNNGGELQMTDNMESCDHALLIHTMDEIVPHITAHTLSVYVENIQEMCNCALTLVVFGVNNYFKKSRKPNKSKAVTELELQLSLTDLMVVPRCSSALVESGSDLALLIAHCTKANAEKPYKLAKRLCDEQADFYMRGDNKKCVPVDKDGHGSSRLWQQMIAVLPLSSLETSRALCAKYKSPLHLYESLQEPLALKEVAATPVERSAAPGARARRLGLEFARKLYILFTSHDGDALVE